MEALSGHHRHRQYRYEDQEVQEERPVRDPDSAFSERSGELGLTRQSQMFASHD